MSSKRRSSSDNDKPPLEPSEQAPFFEVLGRALSTWSGVEAALADIFGDAVNYDNPVPAKVSFWAIVSFDGKRQLADAAVSSMLVENPKLLAKWQKLFEKLKNKSGSRNKIAHGTVVTMTWKPKTKTKRDTFFALRYNEYRARQQITKTRPNSYKPPKHDPRPKDRLSLKQIIQFRKDFAQLRHDLWEFSEALRAHIHEPLSRGQGNTTRVNLALGRL